MTEKLCRVRGGLHKNEYFSNLKKLLKVIYWLILNNFSFYSDKVDNY